MKCPEIAWLPSGPNAILLRFGQKADLATLEWSLAFSAELERNPPAGLVEWTPAITSILLEWERPIRDFSGIATEICAQLRNTKPIEQTKFPLHKIPVRYDGTDLAELATTRDLTCDEVIGLHTATEYRVMMLGFSPAFAYLGELPPALHMPRRAAPRSQIPAGSVAIGGEHTAVYPSGHSRRLEFDWHNDRSAILAGTR